ncbi:hypothetical protein BJP36_27215 [Moorena producens JHB]|uniref:Uncharacterized protein n=1 Tax=Moorena producens (strain JHB) TaxID=1454205 RepID=A0A1D9G5Z8_MOOP1|nr:hypothetical protein [Moorena producens]AOY83058.1 hypothetical protein BJP36_27215 [Moorena producens JHB]
MTTSFEKALNTVSQLPPEQQAMLVEIIQNRLIESRRKEIAQDAKESIATFQQGKLRPQSAETLISQLQKVLEEDP